MKTKLFFSAVSVLLILSACGPAAEDREQMHIRAKVFQDSIANIIRTSMAEAEGKTGQNVMAAPAVDSTQVQQAH